MADGSDLKVTEYDFPKPLLDKAKVQSLESADQPTYNDDLAKVVNQALNWEEGERKSADAAEAAARDAADKAEQKAREDADTALGERIDAETAARESADTQINNDVTAMQAQIDGRLANFVTAPTDGTPTQNMLDADLFETSEVNGDKGVTLKAKSITNEYIDDGSISINNMTDRSILLQGYIYGQQVTEEELVQANEDGRFAARNNTGVTLDVDEGVTRCASITITGTAKFSNGNKNIYNIAPLAVDTSTGLNLSDTVEELRENKFVSLYHPIGIYDMPRTSLASTVLPYTANGPTFRHTYDNPATGVKSVVENFSLVDFGYLQLIVVLADITFDSTVTGTKNAFITVSPEKVFGYSDDNSVTDGWHGVNGATGKYFDNMTGPFFEPFLISEGPDNPQFITSALHHGETGTRIQVSGNTSASQSDFAVMYLLGNMSLSAQAIKFN